MSSSAVFSTGGWAWTPSGYINLGLSNTGNVHIAFKYTSDNTAARTWEIDEVVITGTAAVGLTENQAAQNSTRIFPNPCNGWFNAEMPDNASYVLTINNAQGSTVKAITATNKTMKVETSGLSAGLYFVTVQNVDTGAKEVHKLFVR